MIEAAVRLFGERGIGATSLRALTEAAGSNIAAVNYHFGSKEGLLRAVIDQTMHAVNEERRRRLDTLEASGQPLTLPDLVRAFVEPGVGLTEGHGHRAPEVARFIGRVMNEPDPRIRQIFAEQVDPIEGRYLTAFGRALPELDEDGARFAYAGVIGLLSSYQSGTLTTLHGQPPEKADDDTNRERLVAFITGGLLGLQSTP
nr:TetR/AcrR family transcriptional regulator [Streptomyces coryli]